MKWDINGYQRLSQIKTGEEIRPLMNAHFPGGQCPLFGIMTMLPFVRDVKALIIGPAVCTYNVKLAIGMRSLSLPWLEDNLLSLTLGRDDIVFGMEDRLRQGIEEIEQRFHPEALFLVSTCVPEITGEDLDAMALEMKYRCRARLIVIHTEHFTETDLNVGIERALASFVEIMEPGPVEDNSVNLLGYYNSGFGDTELARLLKSKNINVRRAIPCVRSFSDLSAAPGVKMNLVLEHRALLLAQRMEERFGTEYLYCPRPCSPERVEEWYHRIGQALDVNLNTEVAEMRSEAEAKMNEFYSMLEGKSFGLRGVSGGAFAVARLLVDLGMEPLFIHAHGSLEEDEEDIRVILEAGFDPLMINGEDSAEIDRLLMQLKPDFFIPINYRDLNPAAGMGIAVMSIEAASSRLGFAGGLEMARLLASVDSDHGALYYREQFLRQSKGI